MFDAIVVGGRCAGGATALLLARRGFKVLVVDKTHFHPRSRTATSFTGRVQGCFSAGDCWTALSSRAAQP